MAASPIVRYRLKKLANTLLDDDCGISADSARALYELVEILDKSLLTEIKIGIRATDGRFYYKEK